MSRELKEALKECGDRLDQLTRNLADTTNHKEIELNNLLWWETWEKHKSISAALKEYCQMRWTTKGDFSHLRGVGYVSSRC